MHNNKTMKMISMYNCYIWNKCNKRNNDRRDGGDGSILVKMLVPQHKDQSWDPQKPLKCQVEMVVCL